MSTAKRSRRQAEARSASSPTPKRLKSSHVPAKPGLDFLVDEDARAGKKLDAKLTNGVPQSKSNRVDESHAAVAPDSSDSSGEDEARVNAAPEVIAISSGEEDSSELEEDDNEAHDAQPTSSTNGHTSPDRVQQALVGAEDAEMADADEAAEQDEPTFGDMLQARHPQPIDVQKSFQDADPESRSLVPASGNQPTPSDSFSLGVLLSQALKNNDKDLLETCFSMNDMNSIRATIQRQQSQQIAILLDRIAERIHKRPGRTGKLMVWVQWSLVAHGGYLANQPELMKKLKALGQVVRERANGLQPLLHLKGKLDLLSAQLELRRGLQSASRAVNADNLDDEDKVLYIEAQEQDWSDSDAADENAAGKSRTIRQRVSKAQQSAENDSEDDEMDTGMPNDTTHTADDESSADEEDDERNGMLDIEAEEDSEVETGESDDEEADSDASSVDEDEISEDESEIETTVKQPKASNLNRKR